MSSNEIRYSIENQKEIYEELEKLIESLPQKTSERFEELLEDGNIEEIYNIINSVSPNSNITLSSLKLLSFLQDPELKDKFFSNEEYTSIIKDLADMYGDRLSEIMNINSFSFNMKNLDSLLSYNDPKYTEVYRAVLETKLSSALMVEDVIQVLKNSNTSVISKELITNFLENYNYPRMGSDAREFLKTLPSFILQDGTIAKAMVGKISNIYSGDEEILDYIPSNVYDAEFVKEILDKSEFNFNKVFDHIPTELRTRDILEKACNKSIDYLNQLPNNNVDSNISQDEYTTWMEILITKIIIEHPEDAINIFSSLDDSKKTTRICQKVAESISLENNTYGYNDLLKSIPESSKTPELYATLVSKSPRVLRDIPLQSFVPNISQEEYDRWFENLISQSIANVQDMDALYYSIPREKINERIWNEFLDKCIQNNFDRSLASLYMVNFEHLTPHMVERAMKDIGVTQLYYVPCIDQNLEDLYGATKEKYAKWQASFTEAQKQAYRNWYEQTWIKFVNENQAYGSIYSYVPKEAITAAMNKACIDVDYRSIERMPIPETPEQLHEYQQMLLYALGKIPTIDYKDERTTIIYGDRDILENIPKEYISEEVVRAAVEKNILYLSYANPAALNFSELIDIAYKNKLASVGRTHLTELEKELMQKFVLNNAELFKTLQLEMLDPIIVSAIGVSSLEKIVRYKNVQYLILGIAKNESALKTFGFALENLKMGNIFIESLIEKLSKSVSGQRKGRYSSEAKGYVYESAFLDLVSQRIDRKDILFTDYEKAIISYLALTPQEGRKITSYDEILTFVERKNNELESLVANTNSTLLEVKKAYLERLVGLDYDTVVDLITIYGNDPEQLLKNYNNVNPESYKEIAEKEALEIIIKLKSLIESQDINAIRREFQKSISEERKEESFLRYQKSTILETTLRRAYGRDLVKSLSKNVESLQVEELEFEGEKYYVKKVEGEFNRMISLLGAYRKSANTEGDMYDRWNTNQMAGNHALCYSLINQSNHGTAMIKGKTGVIISINGFSPESLLAAAPYDLCSDNRKNTIFIWRQQRFFSAQNMPNQTRGNYSEYDIEIQDVLSGSDEYRKIQPASIICFEEVDEESIRASIELSKKLGHPVTIELIDRRELANIEMLHITEAFNKFKNDENINPSLIEEIITRFNNVRNAHRFSNLSNELLGENTEKENKAAPFNIEHLNQVLMECLASVEQRIRSGQVIEGLNALECIKRIIFEERQKAFLMPTMYEKQLWTGINMDVDYTIDELQRTYGQQIINSLEGIKSLEVISQMHGQELSSVTFDVYLGRLTLVPQQLSIEQIMQSVDITRIQESMAEIHSQGYYQGNKDYDEEHIARVILYSDAISKMECFDDKTRKLLIEAAKYYSCGRQLDIAENHGQYSAKLAGKALLGKYSEEELRIIQASIELQNFKPISTVLSEMKIERKNKLSELCRKYGISEEQAIIVNNISCCISDSVKLDRTRFIDKRKMKEREKEKDLERLFSIEYLESDSAKKMIKFSYLLQEQLALQELNRLSNIVQINFDLEKDNIMKDFFTEIISFNERKTIDEAVTQSPIIWLEYLKYKYPEIPKMDLSALSQIVQIMEYETKGYEMLQLKAKRRDLRRQKFQARVAQLGTQNVVLTLDELCKAQIELQQLEKSLNEVEDVSASYKMM